MKKIPYSWVGRSNIIKMSVLFKLKYSMKFLPKTTSFFFVCVKFDNLIKEN